MTLKAHCADEFSLMIQSQLQARNICCNRNFTMHLLIHVVYHINYSISEKYICSEISKTGMNL